MQGRTFLLGLVVGGVLASISTWLLTGPTNAPTAPDGGPLVGRTTAPGGRDADRADALRDEIQRLRAELALARGDDGRTPVNGTEGVARAADGSATDGVAVPAAAVPADRRTELLLAEFEDLLRSGVLDERFRQQPMELASFLLQTWCETGHPDRALTLLQRFDLVEEYGGYANWIGGMLEGRGDRALATQAYLIGLKAEPGDWSAILSLAKLDPNAAMQFRAENPPPTEPDGDYRSQSALLLLASGRTEEALSAIDTLIGEGALSEAVWNEFVNRNPAAAEARLRDQIGRGASGEEGTLELLMAAALRNQGRAADARTELERILQRSPEHGPAISALAEMDRGLALEYLKRRVSEQPTPTSWGLYGDQLVQAERREDAIAAFWQAWSLAPEAGYQYRLLELAPERFAAQMVEQATAQNDDELFGDVADALWQAGRRHEAIGYWRRALEIDRTDSEWIEKLRAVDAGRDPLR